MKNVRTFEQFINESQILNEANAKAKTLRQEYRSAWRGLEELDVDVLLNYDYPLEEFGDLFGDREGLKAEFEEWIVKQGLDPKMAWKHERDFLRQGTILKKAKMAFKDKEKELYSRMDKAEAELKKMYPVLDFLSKDMSQGTGPILGMAIRKSGKSWVISTPDEDVHDIDLTSDEVAEYKKYLKDTK